MAPPYLTNACPQLTRDRTCYNLRSGMDVTAPQTRTATYQKSFFPQTIKDWNSLGRTVREVENITKFKDHLKTTTGYKTNKLYQHSMSKPAINQTRMRLGLSGLSSQRFDYKHIDDPKCQTCNAKIEDPAHYFLNSPTYTVQRESFLREICDILHSKDIEVDFRKRKFRTFLITALLEGTSLLNEIENENFFKITQEYISNTKRFP
jgi:hypothetical protein